MYAKEDVCERGCMQTETQNSKVEQSKAKQKRQSRKSKAGQSKAKATAKGKEQSKADVVCGHCSVVCADLFRLS